MNDMIHATCAALDGRGVLLLGPPGAGKSDLAFRLLRDGWRLVADDRVALREESGVLTASAPARLHGLLEVRGLGLIAVETLDQAPVRLALELVAREAEPRLPDAGAWNHGAVSVPLWRLWPFAASAVQKVRLAVGLADGSIAAGA